VDLGAVEAGEDHGVLAVVYPDRLARRRGPARVGAGRERDSGQDRVPRQQSGVEVPRAGAGQVGQGEAVALRERADRSLVDTEAPRRAAAVGPPDEAEAGVAPDLFPCGPTAGSSGLAAATCRWRVSWPTGFAA
jgi:hypothetical protein